MTIRGIFNNGRSNQHQSANLIPWDYHQDLLFDTQKHAYFEMVELINMHIIAMPQNKHTQAIVNDAIRKMIYRAKFN